MPARPYRVAPLQQDAYTWAFPGGPLRVKVPLQLMVRMRAEIDEHRKRHPDPSRVEMGGVLLGREGAFPDTLEIEDYICLPSATTDGKYRWSPTAFRQLGRPNDEKHSVGYFRTESGETLTLRDDELTAVQRDFPDRTNVVLLLHSSAEGCSAGFLFWDGDVFTPFSFMNFPFDVEVLKREANDRPVAALEESEEFELPPQVLLEPEREPLPPPPREERPLRRSTTTFWMLGAALFGLTAGVVILGMRDLLPSLELAFAPVGVRLDVIAQAEGIHVRWDPQSRAVSRARDGRLTVLDGNRPERIMPLTKEQLRIGHVYYEPAGEQTEFRLEVYEDAGPTLKDSVIVVSYRQPETAVQSPAAQLPAPQAPLPRRQKSSQNGTSR